VIDNAIQYSFKDTIIDVEAAFNGKSQEIRVRNEGLRICANDVHKVTEKGWRSHEAELTTVGMGLGLWISSIIMKEQKGRLIVSPTTDGGVTEVTLRWVREE
jgi:signal transduction histidine kinase